MRVTNFVAKLNILCKDYLKSCFSRDKIYLYTYVQKCEVKKVAESQNNFEAQVPVYLFHQGNNARAYEYMGIPMNKNE